MKSDGNETGRKGKTKSSKLRVFCFFIENEIKRTVQQKSSLYLFIASTGNPSKCRHNYSSTFICSILTQRKSFKTNCSYNNGSLSERRCDLNHYTCINSRSYTCISSGSNGQTARNLTILQQAALQPPVLQIPHIDHPIVNTRTRLTDEKRRERQRIREKQRRGIETPEK